MCNSGIHCLKSVSNRSFSGPYYPAFGLAFVSLRIQSKCGIRTRETPITDLFYAVIVFYFKYSKLKVPNYMSNKNGQ